MAPLSRVVMFSSDFLNDSLSLDVVNDADVVEARRAGAA
jgi:hypothetical protein